MSNPLEEMYAAGPKQADAAKTNDGAAATVAAPSADAIDVRKLREIIKEQSEILGGYLSLFYYLVCTIAFTALVVSQARGRVRGRGVSLGVGVADPSPHGSVTSFPQMPI